MIPQQWLEEIAAEYGLIFSSKKLINEFSGQPIYLLNKVLRLWNHYFEETIGQGDTPDQAIVCAMGWWEADR